MRIIHEDMHPKQRAPRRGTQVSEEVRQFASYTLRMIWENGRPTEDRQRKGRVLDHFGAVRREETGDPDASIALGRGRNIRIDLVCQSPDQAIAVPEVVVDGHGIDADASCQRAHGQALETLGIQYVQCFIKDLRRGNAFLD